MNNLRRKVTIAALTASAVLGGLALPATASADGQPAVQIMVCNDTSARMEFWVKGYNQFGDWDDSPVWTANSATCATGWNFWWKKNASVELHYKIGNGAWTWKAVYIPRTNDSRAMIRVP
ncbi:hypothetical protein OG352_38990 [Streptomyces sp. NBC_01485]|uniref:hypothetical protein n=1 Tax=Streptomyces sp. NBC_01485 TaxID=2903884 RepID=UPI002E30E924|nr:hypothetical protein [Streptomyces sp. NBC_01485]